MLNVVTDNITYYSFAKLFCLDKIVIIIMVVNLLIMTGHRVLQNEADGDWIWRSREDHTAEGPDEEVQDSQHKPGHCRGHSAGLEVRTSSLFSMQENTVTAKILIAH